MYICVKSLFTSAFLAFQFDSDASIDRGLICHGGQNHSNYSNSYRIQKPDLKPALSFGSDINHENNNSNTVALTSILYTRSVQWYSSHSRRARIFGIFDGR